MKQKGFEEIMTRLIKPPVLHLLDNKERFYLFSDTSRAAAGSASYHIQNGTPKLIVNVSKDCHLQQ